MEVRCGYKQTEVGVIPEDWEVKPLAEVAAIRHGFGFQSLYFKLVGRYWLTTPGHFRENGGFRSIGDKQKFYDGPLPDGYLLTKGDLIVAMTEQADGLLGSAALVPTDGNYLHNQRIGRVKVLTPEVSVGFLYRVFNSKSYRAKVRETAAGTKVKHTSPSKLLEIPVALPTTLAEQEAIAQALSDVDALIGALDQLIAKKRDLKQAAMQQLLTGKKRLPRFEVKHGYKQTEVGMIPEDWEVKHLGELGSVVRGGSPRPAGDPRYFNGDFIPWLTVASLTNISENQTRVTHTVGYLTKEGANHSRTLASGTLIIANSGATLGVAKMLGVTCCANDGIAAIINQKDGDKEFACHYINSKTKLLREAVATGNGQPNLNTKLIRELPIPFPPTKAEQRAIAEVLCDMDAELVALGQRRDKTRDLKQGMMQELLTGRIRLV